MHSDEAGLLRLFGAALRDLLDQGVALVQDGLDRLIRTRGGQRRRPDAATSSSSFGPVGRQRVAASSLVTWAVLAVNRQPAVTHDVVASGTWETFPHDPADAEDADIATVRAAAASGEAVQFRFVGDNHYFFGFPVDVSEIWALVHIINRDVVALDGHIAVRADCLFEAEVIEDSDTFMLRAIERRGERPLNPGLPLGTHKTLLAALSERYPLIGLSDATMSDQVAVGRITRLAADEVTLRGVTTGGEWTTNKQHLYKNIEAIRFGLAYEAALASVLP